MTAAALAPEALVSAADRPRLFDLASLLLSYPDAELRSAITEIAGAAVEIEDEEVRALLARFVVWFSVSEAEHVEQHYVRTFDLQRKSGLYLTYYLHGDTRKRGLALLTLKQRYRAHGFALPPGQLPDLLPVVLEFAALAGPGDGEAPLRQHRRGLELLRQALADSRSPYQYLLEAVTRALPPLTEADHAAVAALAAEGPPMEAVGLAPFGGADELASVGLAPEPTSCPSWKAPS